MIQILIIIFFFQFVVFQLKIELPSHKIHTDSMSFSIPTNSLLLFISNSTFFFNFIWQLNVLIIFHVYLIPYNLINSMFPNLDYPCHNANLKLAHKLNMSC